MGNNGKQIDEYISQRKEDYVKTKEREREAIKVNLKNRGLIHNEYRGI